MLKGGLNDIYALFDYVNQNGGRSFDRIKELKDNGILDQLIIINGVDLQLRNEFIRFINILDDPSLENFPHYKKIILYNFNKLIYYFSAFGYEIGAYLNNYEVYRNFPVFIKELGKKFGISYYGNASIEELDEKLSKYLDISHSNNINSGNYDVLIKFKSNSNSDKYKEYLWKKENNKLDLNQRDDFYIYAEDWTCTFENELLNTNNQQSVWVAKDYGDGYGYDVYSYNIATSKEIIIEVKSGVSKNFILTENEYNTMMNTENMDTTEFVIYKFLNENGRITYNIYKYNDQNKLLVAVNDPSNVCLLQPDYYYDEYNNKKDCYAAINETYDYNKAKVLGRTM